MDILNISIVNVIYNISGGSSSISNNKVVTFIDLKHVFYYETDSPILDVNFMGIVI